MLVLGDAVREALQAALQDEPAGPAGSIGQDGVGVGHPAVADPLLRAGDPVPDRGAALDDRDGDGLQRAEVGARLGLGGTVSEQQSLLGDPAQPLLLLDVCAADRDRVTAQERGQHPGGQAEVDAGHLLTHAVDVEGPAAHPAVLLGDEQQLDAELGPAHRPDDLDRSLILRVQLEQPAIGQLLLRELADGGKRHLERICVQSGHGPGSLPFGLWFRLQPVG